MTRTPRRRRRSPLVVALYVNAGLLAAVLVAVVSRGQGVGATAMAAGPALGAQPIAGGSGLYLMPGQLSQYTWGCYVMDVDRQTLCAYEYLPGTKQTRLVSARNFAFDRQLQDYNTAPSPDEIKRLTQVQGQAVRGAAGAAVGPGTGGSPAAPDGPAGERPPTRPPRPGDADYVPTPDEVNRPDPATRPH
ncbi:MAG: hypothetical protein JWO31_1407 [Phycisphaerales bacterium]|nr:hypothetical protein [Phycisphaerales bacterium]